MITNMLGAVGFFAAALAVGWFAYSYKKSYPGVVHRVSLPVVSAYTILCFVMLLLSVSFTLIDNGFVGINTVILIVDALMFASTVLFLGVIFPWFQKPFGIAISTFVVGTLLAIRATVYFPTAFIENGIMHFGLEGEPRFILLGALLFVWLPATVIAARHALRSLGLSHLKQLFGFGYLTLVLFSATFFSARQEIMVILTFVMMIALFAILGLANMLVRNVKPAINSTHSKGHHGRK